MTFSSGQDMYDTLDSGDIYNPEKELYVFLYAEKIAKIQTTTIIKAISHFGNFFISILLSSRKKTR